MPSPHPAAAIALLLGFASLGALTLSAVPPAPKGLQIADQRADERAVPREPFGGQNNPPVATEDEVLVRVNGRPVTQADLELAYLVRGIPPEHREALRRPLLERLIDERLIASFLKQRRIKPPAASLDAQLDQILALIRRRGEEPDEFLARLGLDQQQLRTQLTLPLSWRTFVREVVTAGRMRDYFDKHRRELDGTQLRARHIVVKVAPDASAGDWERATSQLEAVRKQITGGNLTFAEAARQSSQGPSAAAGGDVGYFLYRGVMPAAFADVAFSLKPGELSRPVRSHAGLHIIEVTDERSGQLSMEDVRETVLGRLSSELWEQQLARERTHAQILWSGEEESPQSP